MRPWSPRRPLLRLSLVPLLVGYLALMGFMTLTQDQLLYRPDPSPPSTGNMSARRGPALATWPEGEGAAFRGYVRAPAGKVEAAANPVAALVRAPRDSDTTPSAPLNTTAPRGTVLVFHGNAGSARDRAYYLPALEPLGVRVVLAEYPGYGGRPGQPSEAGLVADGRETLRQVRAAYGDPVWVWGESLGAAVAAQVGADPAGPATGVFLITPWDNLPDLAQSLYWYLPARWLVRDAYDSRAALQGYRGPIGVLIASQDQIIPPVQGQRLYAALPGPKRQWLFPTADHNSWPAGAGAGWWREALEWLMAAGDSHGSAQPPKVSSISRQRSPASAAKDLQH